jgi:hypothetical protein
MPDFLGVPYDSPHVGGTTGTLWLDDHEWPRELQMLPGCLARSFGYPLGLVAATPATLGTNGLGLPAIRADVVVVAGLEAASILDVEDTERPTLAIVKRDAVNPAAEHDLLTPQGAVTVLTASIPWAICHAARSLRCFISCSPIHSLGVGFKNLPSELHQVLNATTLRLPCHPELEILGAVIEFDAVPMVDGLTRAKGPTKHPLHNKAMLEHALAMAVDALIDVAVCIDVGVPCANEGFQRATLAPSFPVLMAEPMTSDLPPAVRH